MKMNIEFLDPNQATIEIPKTEPFIKSAKDISGKVSALNLPNQEHNILVKALLQHTEIARQEAFMSGFSMGAKFGEDSAKGGTQK